MILLPDPANGSSFCPGDNIELTGRCAGTPVRVEWSVESKPPGGQLTLNTDDATTIIASANVNGDYKVNFCCHYQDGPDALSIITGPFLDCKRGAPWNETIQIEVTGCDSAVTFDWTIVGADSFITNNNEADITPNQFNGSIQVFVICTDENGVQSPADCQITVFDPAIDLVYSDSEPFCVSARECLETCYCQSAIISINCEPKECEEICIDINARSIVANAVIEECVPVEPVALVGVKQAFVPPDTENCCDGCGLSSCGCDEPEDEPNFIWNDCARCPNWAVQGDAANASDCQPGNPWCFTDSGTYTVSSTDGSECSVDVIYIYGHNIEQATITASVPIFGGDRDVSVCYDRAKIGGFKRAIVVPLAGLFTATEFSFTITGVGVGGQPICIDYAMMGQKLFLPDNRMPADFVNPLDGCDRELTVTNSECGVLSRVSRQRPVDWEITIEAPNSWACDYWRSFMRYLGAGNPVIFQPSRNNKEQDSLMGWKAGQQSGSSWVECCDVSVTLSVTGFIHQPEGCVIPSNGGATTTDGGGGPTECPEHYSICVKKSADPGPYQVGQNVTYNIEIKNTGTATQSGITLNDPILDTLVPLPASIGAGATVNLVGTHVVTPADVAAGFITNTATVTTAQGASDSDSVTVLTESVDVDEPCASIAKEANKISYQIGEQIVWTITITNCGNVELTGVSLGDPGVTLTGGASTIPVGGSATWTGTQTATVAGEVTNAATVTTDQTGAQSASETVTVLPETQIQACLVGSVVDSQIKEGEALTFCVELQDTAGNPIPAQGLVSFDISFAGSNTTGSDFDASGANLITSTQTIANGQSKYSVSAMTVIDSIVEPTEQVQFNFSNPVFGAAYSSIALKNQSVVLNIEDCTEPVDAVLLTCDPVKLEKGCDYEDQFFANMPLLQAHVNSLGLDNLTCLPANQTAFGVAAPVAASSAYRIYEEYMALGAMFCMACAKGDSVHMQAYADEVMRIASISIPNILTGAVNGSCMGTTSDVTQGYDGLYYPNLAMQRGLGGAMYAMCRLHAKGYYTSQIESYATQIKAHIDQYFTPSFNGFYTCGRQPGKNWHTAFGSFQSYGAIGKILGDQDALDCYCEKMTLMTNLLAQGQSIPYPGDNIADHLGGDHSDLGHATYILFSVAFEYMDQLKGDRICPSAPVITEAMLGQIADYYCQHYVLDQFAWDLPLAGIYAFFQQFGSQSCLQSGIEPPAFYNNYYSQANEWGATTLAWAALGCAIQLESDNCP